MTKFERDIQEAFDYCNLTALQRLFIEHTIREIVAKAILDSSYAEEVLGANSQQTKR